MLWGPVQREWRHSSFPEDLGENLSEETVFEQLPEGACSISSERSSRGSSPWHR